jgi:HrpA-like RNA helicase
MVGELVETSRLWGRTAARIDPLWVERLADHLVKRSYSEPRWERKRGSAVATERVTLYGLPLVAARTVAYGRIDPELSRELFIRHALVEGDWRTSHPFFHENRPVAGGRGGPGGPGPAPGHPGRRRHPVRLLRPADPGRHRLHRALSTAGGSRPGPIARTC